MERKKHSTEFKCKIVLELLKEELSLSQLASGYGIHPNLVSRWKTEFMEGMPRIFSKENAEAEKIKKEYEKQVEELYTQLGKLTAQNEWLKKKYRA